MEEKNEYSYGNKNKLLRLGLEIYLYERSTNISATGDLFLKKVGVPGIIRIATNQRFPLFNNILDLTPSHPINCGCGEKRSSSNAHTNDSLTSVDS